LVANLNRAAELIQSFKQVATGLGLHIVYSIVTNCLGGRLNLDSESGQGTKIQLILPAWRQHRPVLSSRLARKHSNRQLGEGK
jgi:signal transduction histidine kinase